MQEHEWSADLATHDDPARHLCPALPRHTAVIVLAVATLINAVSFAASQLWVSPDASYYVELAGGLADRLELRSQLFLIRPPGYPIFLAFMFRLFGAASPTAIMFVQHLMVIGVVYIITLIGWRIVRQSWAALAAGIMTACSLQLITYANLVMTEVPYTLATVGAVYFLVVFYQTGQCRALALASLLVGIGYTFRPIGMVLLPICVAAAFCTTTCTVTRSAEGNDRPGITLPLLQMNSSRFRNSLQRLTPRLACATLPALAVYLPCLAQNQLIHGGDLSTRCADLALYFRIVYMDKLDSTQSESLNGIRQTVADASAKGLIPSDADYRLWGPVWHAYEKSQGIGLADSSRIMGQAARDLIAEHPLSVLDGTIRYSLWMILVPDGFYRFHPGGAPGICDVNGECRRNPNAAVLASNTYEPMMRPWTGPQKHYLPLQSDSTEITPLWRRINGWFHENIEKGPSILGLGDTPYEAFGWLCIAGMVAAVWSRQRRSYLIVIAAIGLQIVVSAFLAGPTPRYAVPVRPLLALFPVIPMALSARRLAMGCANLMTLFRNQEFKNFLLRAE